MSPRTKLAPGSIIGKRLFQARTKAGITLKQLHQRTGISVSYLSDLERGRIASPGREKLAQISETLAVPVNKLLFVDQDDADWQAEELLQRFSVALGLKPTDPVRVVSSDPTKANLLVLIMSQLMRSFGIKTQEVIRSAVQVYQKAHGNYFEEQERQAYALRQELDWGDDRPIDEEIVTRIENRLKDLGYQVDSSRLGDPEREGPKHIRWIYANPGRPVLFVHRDLDRWSERKAFICLREIYLAKKRRPGSGHRVIAGEQETLYEKAVDFYSASYFAGACALPVHVFENRFGAFIKNPSFEPALFEEARMGLSLESFMIRIGEIAPFIWPELVDFSYTRHEYREGEGMFLTRAHNMTDLPDLRSVRQHLHFCRRWLGARQLLGTFEGSSDLAALRTEYYYDELLSKSKQLFVISGTDSDPMNPTRRQAMSIAFIINDGFKERVRFWNDPKLDKYDQKEASACERCSWECAERAHYLSERSTGETVRASMYEQAKGRRRQLEEARAFRQRVADGEIRPNDSASA